MDTIIEALVTGASDETILEMIAEKEKEEEVHQNEEENKEEVEQPKYRSCIKIRGRPILPPVMTDEVRLECQEWKRRALEEGEQPFRLLRMPGVKPLGCFARKTKYK